MKIKELSLFLCALLCAACTSDDMGSSPETVVPPSDALVDNLIICNEGLWQSDNGQLSYYDAATNVLTNKWFQTVNMMKLGDTPNDLIQVNDTLIAVTVNWSNIVQYLRPDGTACGATEDVPNNRRMCADGHFLYVTSYAHRCGNETFEKGFVAKIDIRTKRVVATCATGWEPEGIRIYKGRLYVANTGGYAFTENHDYESTIQVIDAATMQPIKTIDTGCINLCGDMAQAGRWLCVASGGDYYYVESRSVLIDCETDAVTILPFSATLCATDGRQFYCVGNEFSYLTNESCRTIHTFNPSTGSATDLIYNEIVTAKLRGLQSPYALYVSPYTGNVYFTDAKTHGTAGVLYGFSPQGEQLFVPQKVYINPGRILAVKPGGGTSTPDLPSGSDITVLEYCPAPGQFVNKMPEATADDTPETMTRKCTVTLRDGGLVSLGGFGGYITFTFGRPVANIRGENDFRIYGNAHDGSAEPGIVMVSRDTNGNGLPDDEWYELAGSADADCPEAVTYNHEITYTRAAMHDDYPLWLPESLTFRGTLLPDNGTDTSGNGTYWVLRPFRFGYVDNLPNADRDGNSFNIEWAVDKNRQPVELESIDFVRVYCAMQQQCGWLGETSTEVSGAEIIE